MKASSYIKRYGLENTFWGKRIMNAEDDGEFSFEDIEKAADWQTCACGKADKRIPRSKFDRCPLDGILSDLGQQFYESVDSFDPLKAAELMVKIEERAKIVISKL